MILERWPPQQLRANGAGQVLGSAHSHLVLRQIPVFNLSVQLTISMVGLPATNNHHAEKSETSPRGVFVLSAADKEAVKAQAEQLATYLKSEIRASEPDFLRDLAFTLTNRRSLFPWRIALTAVTVEGLMDELEKPGLEATRILKGSRLGFVFTGQGSQWARMGRELMSYNIFAETMQEAERCLKGLGAGWSLLGMTFPIPRR